MHVFVLPSHARDVSCDLNGFPNTAFHKRCQTIVICRLVVARPCGYRGGHVILFQHVELDSKARILPVLHRNLSDSNLVASPKPAFKYLLMDFRCGKKSLLLSVMINRVEEVRPKRTLALKTSVTPGTCRQPFPAWCQGLSAMSVQRALRDRSPRSSIRPDLSP